MNLTLPRPPGGIADAKFEKVGIFIDQHVDESALFGMNCTLPTPEHPVITSGLYLTMSL